jgi:ubiquinone/menaquinone biosynthesis C-methylase UbiE
MGTPLGDYPARWGYRTIDPIRYEVRRYGSGARRLNQHLLTSRLRRALEGVAGGTVLDVPCGTGVLKDLFASLRLRVTSADISPAMLAVAGERGGTVRVRADIERLPFRRDAFDAVVCNRFLMHLPASLRPAVLADLGRVSRGPVVFTVCHPYTLKSASRAFRRRLGLWTKRQPRIRREALAAEVAEAGLRLRDVAWVAPLLSEVWVVVAERNGRW